MAYFVVVAGMKIKPEARVIEMLAHSQRASYIVMAMQGCALIGVDRPSVAHNHLSVSGKRPTVPHGMSGPL